MLEKLDHKLIWETRRRIEQSLNKRFEKDADLFLPIYELEKIKKIMREQNYYKLRNLFIHKQVSADILTRIIINNSWLFREIDRKDFYDFFAIIFEQSNFRILDGMMKNVLEDRIDMPESFRRELIQLYVKCLDNDRSQELLTRGSSILHDTYILSICARNAVMGQETGQKKYGMINRLVKKYPKLSEGKFLSEIFEENELQELSDKILYEQVLAEETQLSKMWRNWFFRSDPLYAFDRVKRYILENTYDETKIDPVIGKKILSNLINYNEEHRETFRNEFVELFSKISNENIVYKLLNVVSRVKENSLKVEILDSIQYRISSCNNGIKKHWQNIKNDTQRSNEGEMIQSLDEIIEKLRECTLKDERKINYLSGEFNDNFGNADSGEKVERLYLALVGSKRGEEILSLFMVLLVKKFFFNRYYLTVVMDRMNDFKYERANFIKILFKAIQDKDINKRLKDRNVKTRLSNFIRKEQW